MTSSLPDPAVTFAPLLAEIRALYGPGPIPLHRPVFEGPERRWLVDCIDSNFVSSVGARVTEFEERVAAFTLLRYPRFRFRPSQADALHVDLWAGGCWPGAGIIRGKGRTGSTQLTRRLGLPRAPLE
jgi:hypothetical protein